MFDFVRGVLGLIFLGSCAHVAFTYFVWATSGARVDVKLLRAMVTELALTIVGALTWPIGLVRLNARTQPPPGQAPVILLHGYLMTWANFLYLLRALRQRGLVSLHPVTLGRWLAPMDTLAKRLSREIDGVLERTGAVEVDVVAHSMGGLITRRVMELDAVAGRCRVRRLVTLGSPHRGTRLAELAVGYAGRSMRHGSEFLTSLTVSDRVTAIWSTHDNVVVPADSGDPGDPARSERLEGLGHFTLLFHPAVAERVVRALAGGPSTSALAEPHERRLGPPAR